MKISEIIRKTDAGYVLYSKSKGKDGKRKKLGGPYKSRAGAEKRERQVQYFKHMGEQGIQPDEPGYQHTLLTAPQNTLVIDKSDDMDFYKLGQHYANLTKLDPHEIGVGSSDILMNFATKKELYRMTRILDRMGVKYRDISGSHEHPEVHSGGSAMSEATLDPDKNFMQDLEWVIDQANKDYQQFLADNNDKDDIDELAELIEFHNDDELPIEVFVNHKPRKDPDEWISAVADYDPKQGALVQIILHAKNLEGSWGPKTFKEMMLKMIAHETIHFNQYSKMGAKAIAKHQSGHQKGTAKRQAGGTERDWMRSYLRDPHEIMAYGHDLAGEIAELDDPQQVLRSIEQYKNQLPTYSRFRKIFDRNTPQMKMLLKYTSQYLNKTESLDEAFDQPYPISMKKKHDGGYFGVAKLADGSALDISIDLVDEGFPGMDAFDIDFKRNSKHTVTGEGDAFKVFATVMDAIRQFILMYKRDSNDDKIPYQLTFTASKTQGDVEKGNTQSRAKLYNRMVKKFADKMGYAVDIGDYEHVTEYELLRKR